MKNVEDRPREHRNDKKLKTSRFPNRNEPNKKYKVNEKTLDIENQLRLQREKATICKSELHAQHSIKGFSYDFEKDRYFKTTNNCVHSPQSLMLNPNRLSERLDISSLFLRELIYKSNISKRLLMQLCVLEHNIMQETIPCKKVSSFHPIFGFAVTDSSRIRYQYHKFISLQNKIFQKVQWSLNSTPLIAAVVSSGSSSSSPTDSIALFMNPIQNRTTISLSTNNMTHSDSRMIKLSNSHLDIFSLQWTIEDKLLIGNSKRILSYNCDHDIHRETNICELSSPPMALCLAGLHSKSFYCGVRNGSVYLTDTRMHARDIRSGSSAGESGGDESDSKRNIRNNGNSNQMALCKMKYCIDHLWCLSDECRVVVQDISGAVSVYDTRVMGKCPPHSHATAHSHGHTPSVSVIAHTNGNGSSILANQGFWVTSDESAIMLIPPPHLRGRSDVVDAHAVHAGPVPEVSLWSLLTSNTKIRDVSVSSTTDVEGAYSSTNSGSVGGFGMQVPSYSFTPNTYNSKSTFTFTPTSERGAGLADDALHNYQPEPFRDEIWRGGYIFSTHSQNPYCMTSKFF